MTAPAPDAAPGPVRVAAIDCGTNSIRLLVAELDPAAGTLTDLDRRMEIVRLGQGVDRTGRLAPEALERTFAACRRYAEVIRAHGVPPGRTRFVATSASRDAGNRDEFTRGVHEITGVFPEVISGDEEARLSFAGATRELAGAGAVPAPDAPALVVDIGGGSTEFVLGTPGDGVRAARSVDIGCVRLTERHLTEDGRPVEPLTADRLSALTADVRAALAEAERTVPLHEARALVGLAGSVTTVAALALGLDEYDASAVHHSRFDRPAIAAVTAWLVSSTHAERAARKVIHPGRVDVITAGAMVLDQVMEYLGAPELVVSEHDILDGIAWSAG
ncbi:Ppx/GppA phosphatase family protein [Streptomyces aidingensis]|uniref:Exopolyphosphatase / guanosine-5'-triphosphate,3'-diphosphate pyrophosphatase n=1 Tax=Streptomyces aidingensis TaxID=910347 RepID=A0A1I1GXC3_9ACTN|nr:Ppx/GppA phosphatase family protein [Streptomyces aidingensis]SFC13823.1 exopolyphosphatase / guanosine-5'-triphosphate,3'-diphosphate pyrophosphatase [Streptomyces aidingensis]